VIIFPGVHVNGDVPLGLQMALQALQEERLALPPTRIDGQNVSNGAEC
jgi:hypothetical protein